MPHYMILKRTNQSVLESGIHVGIFSCYPYVLNRPDPSLFSCDLISGAKSLLNYLSIIDEEEIDIKKSLIRYSMFLNLQSLYLEKVMIPPFDVEMIWLHHMLQSFEYRDYAREVKPGLENIPHIITRMLNQNEREILVHETKLIWENIYGKDSYDNVIELDVDGLNFYMHYVINNLTVDKKWFREFKKATKCDEMDLKDIPNEYFERALLGYQKFLYLMTKYPSYTETTMFSPCPSIDLIWHTHLIQPKCYEKDSQFLTFSTRDHKLIQEDLRTIQNYDTKIDIEEKLWTEEFGESMAIYLPLTQC